MSNRQSRITSTRGNRLRYSPPGASLEDPAMEPSAHGDASGQPTIDRSEGTDHGEETDSTCNNPPTGCLAYLREKYKDEELSEEATSLLLKLR